MSPEVHQWRNYIVATVASASVKFNREGGGCGQCLCLVCESWRENSDETNV